MNKYLKEESVSKLQNFKCGKEPTFNNLLLSKNVGVLLF